MSVTKRLFLGRHVVRGQEATGWRSATKATFVTHPTHSAHAFQTSILKVF